MPESQGSGMFSFEIQKLRSHIPAKERCIAMKERSARIGTILIIAAGVLWATMGVFVRRLGEYGFDSFQIAAFRLTVAALGFSFLLLTRGREGFRIRPRDIGLFLGMGVGSIAVMTCCYFTAIRMLTMSAAAILLYTSPIWVMLMSALFFRERITARKLLALAFAFGGCILVSDIGGGNIRPLGIAVGVASGVAYGLYSILGTIALRRYSPYTVTAYTFIFAALGVLITARPGETIRMIASTDGLGGLIALIAATGVVTAVIPFLIYTIGLKSVEPSRAAILATSEPMMATLIGMMLYGEGMSIASAAGIACILIAILALNSGK